MENEKQTENFENQLTTAAVGFLQESAKWSKFMAIIGFIGIGLMVLVSLFMAIGFGAMGASTMPELPFSMSVFSIIYVLFAAIYFFPVYYLYQFASKAKAAFATDNNEQLNASFEYLKSHYKFFGIFTLVSTIIYALILVLGIIGGIMSRM